MLFGFIFEDNPGSGDIVYLLTCVTYEEYGGGPPRHTGVIAQIVPTGQKIIFIDGVEIQGDRVKTDRPSFGWENYAD